MHAMLKIENVSKSFATHTALNEVSFSIPQGSIFGLLGPNGAGKTTLIRIINQITGPDSGSIYFNGEALRPEYEQRIGYLPEERGLYKKMKVGEQALYLAQLKGLEKKEALRRLKEWFVRFEIEGWWNKKVEELSKGMAQKIQFIVTVVHEPELLILDEPFSGFDPINTNLIKSEIMRLREQGSTIIFSTHNMNSVEEICDHIALIHQSEKILEGSVKDVKQQFKPNEYLLKFSGSLIAFTNALWTGFELIDNKQEDDIITARVRMLKEQSPNDLLNSILPHVQVLGLEEILPSMNDIFIQKVSEMGKETMA